MTKFKLNVVMLVAFFAFLVVTECTAQSRVKSADTGTNDVDQSESPVLSDDNFKKYLQSLQDFTPENLWIKNFYPDWLPYTKQDALKEKRKRKGDGTGSKIKKRAPDSLRQRKRRAMSTITIGKPTVTYSAIGSVYTRWGYSSCPSTSTLVYEGYTAGGSWRNSGVNAAPICLTKEPVFVSGNGYCRNTVYNAKYTYIYGTEYECPVQSGKHDQDVPCAVCRTNGRSSVHMLPGKNTCEIEWTEEYKGYLMAGHFSQAKSTDYVCVDEEMEAIPGGYADKNGQLFYHVSPQCGWSLQCPPYKANAFLTCAVCSK